MDPLESAASQSDARPTGRQQLVWLSIFVAATIAASWPFAVSWGRAPSLHPDYFQNIWNMWWVHEALFSHGVSPYFTNWLLHPAGVSLARHTLSPLNSFTGALLLGTFEAADIYRVELLAHFALSGWATARLAYELTHSHVGAIVAGLIFSLSPFHFFYLSEINMASMELLPLVIWLAIRCLRVPGPSSPLALGLCAGLLAASCLNYLVLSALCCALIAVTGGIWSPAERLRTGRLRLALGATFAVLCVAAVAAPLLSEQLRGGPVALVEDVGHVARRSNDLLGYLWVRLPEPLILSWPSLIGYASLAIAVVGFRARRVQLFWAGLAIGAWILSLGPGLRIDGEDTGIAMPFAALAELPLLDMMRNPDRFVVLTQLGVALLAAHACAELAIRSRANGSLGRAALAVAPLIVLLEFLGPPLDSFLPQPPAYAAALEKLDGAAVIEVPDRPRGIAGPRAVGAMFAQMYHGKPIGQAYVTSFALSPGHYEEGRRWARAQRRLISGASQLLVEQSVRNRIDLIVLHKTIPTPREHLEVPSGIVWSPFSLVRRSLVATRQQPHAPEMAWNWQPAARDLEGRLGSAVYEDDDVQIYSLRGRTSVSSPDRVR